MAETSATPLSATPLTDKALSRLRTLAEGNGIDPAAINVLRTDESIYTIRAELTLTPRWELGVATPQEMKSMPSEPLAGMEALRDKAGREGYPSRWWVDAIDELRTMPGEGWGLDQKAIRLDQQTRLFNIQETCPACTGNGAVTCSSCRGTGQMPCQFCQNTGKDPRAPGGSNDPGTPPCPECNGTLMTRCTACNGNGSRQCPTCRGQGQKATVYALKLYADARFAWATDGTDLPTPLRRSVDRAGLDRLARGHATIKRGDIDEDNLQGPPRIPYTATLPFATTQLDINGSKHTAQLLGLKGAILELPDFLDKQIEQAEQQNTLPALRIFHEAQVIRARRGKVADLMKFYPAGLSKNAADRLLQQAGHKLHTSTRDLRWQAFGIGISAAILASFFYLHSGIRNLLITGPVTLEQIDLGFPVLLAAGFVIFQRWWMKRMLEKRLNQSGLRPPFFSPLAFLGILVVLTVYVLLLFYTTELPTWLALHKMWIEAYLNRAPT
ncbi:MAG: hypothetical protein AB7G06_06645 [Bdellovibrionales bacterium]